MTNLEMQQNALISKELDIIAAFGYFFGQQPQKTTGTTAFFFAPWRDERTPSVAVKFSKLWAWFDHGAGVGGNVFDLLRLGKHWDSAESMAEIDKAFYKLKGVKGAYREAKALGNSTIEVLHNIGSQNPLVHYLSERRIDIANRPPQINVLFEQWDLRKSKTFYYVGVHTSKGGFAVRNAAFKGFKGRGGYSFFPRTFSDKLFVFEGFMDFWGYWLIQPRVAESNVLILNSVANVGTFDYSEFKHVFGCLDYDSAGEIATSFLRPRCRDFVDVSVLLHGTGCKDFAELWEKRAIKLP